jgi:hypothetical protein
MGFTMIKVYIPEIKRKYNKKILARGFWRNEAGKVYYDYIAIKEYKQIINDDYYTRLFYNYLDNIKSGYNQECIFYKINDIGYIYYSRDKIIILPHRIYKEVLRNDLKNSINQALKNYSGITVYKEAGRYFIEVFATI